MAYVLKHENEFERLEAQSKLPNYDFKKELTHFAPKKGESVLDACCGTGLVSRHFASKHLETQFFGCDIGEDNLIKAKNEADALGLTNIRFIKEDVTKLSFKANFFDHVICRYAIQHVPKDARKTALSEYLRVLKPGGTLTLIDFDGTLYNLYPLTTTVAEVFSTLKSQNTIDLHIGRKLPCWASEVGFKNVAFKIDCLSFMENGLEEEVNQLKMRFENAKEFLANSIGDELTFKKFEKEFFECLTSPGATYFYNKFIVTAVK